MSEDYKELSGRMVKVNTDAKTQWKPIRVQWMTTKEVCEYIKVARATLLRYIKEQGFPGHKMGHYWRFDRNEVDAWIRGGVHHKVFFIESEKDHDL